MNIVLNINNIFENGRLEKENLFFLDKKRNMIMDGAFAKVIFSDELLTMNGLYLNCPLYTQPIDKFQKKNMIWFQPYHVNNLNIIQNFCLLEREILDYYKEFTGSNKMSSFVLYNQLYSGNAKLYQNQYFSNSPAAVDAKYIIKISGIWESDDRIGITYKFQGTQGTYGSPNPSLSKSAPLPDNLLPP